jgi:hypothetical protein
VDTTNHKFTPIYRDSIYYVILILSTIIVYSQMAGHDFINFDDPLQLTANNHVLSGLTWKNILWSFGPDSQCGPLTWLVYTAGHVMFGLNPGSFHVMSLILHIASSLLLFSVLNRMTGEAWKSAFVGALFALHPMNVESVAWVAELNNVLSGLFFMLTLLAYKFYTEHTNLEEIYTCITRIRAWSACQARSYDPPIHADPIGSLAAQEDSNRKERR